MEEFVQQAMGALGTTEKTTKAAAGVLLGFLNRTGPAAEVNQLLDALPGARDLMAHAQPAGSGVVESLGLAASAVGVEAGGAAGLLAALTTAGLEVGSASTFVSMFADFAKAKAGPELVTRLLAAVPGVG